MRAFVIVAVLAIAVPDRPDPTPKQDLPPQNQILGDWQDRNNRIHMLRFVGGESVFMVNGQASAGDGLTANVFIDWSKNPATIDFMPKQRGGKMMGILKLDGDQLNIALTTGNGPRPTNLAVANLVLHYQRVKK